MKILWILDCWLEKRGDFKTSLWALGSCALRFCHDLHFAFYVRLIHNVKKKDCVIIYPISRPAN